MSEDTIKSQSVDAWLGMYKKVVTLETIDHGEREKGTTQHYILGVKVREKSIVRKVGSIERFWNELKGANLNDEQFTHTH